MNDDWPNNVLVNEWSGKETECVTEPPKPPKPPEWRSMCSSCSWVGHSGDEHTCWTGIIFGVWIMMLPIGLMLMFIYKVLVCQGIIKG
jgi:hypothetical protein